MSGVRKDLYDRASEEFRELTWQKGIPVIPGVALDTFFVGCRNAGMRVFHNKDRHTFYFNFQLNGKRFERSSEFSSQQLLTGFGDNPPGCAKEMYNSAYNLLRSFDFDLGEDRNDFYVHYTSFGGMIRDGIDKALLEWIHKYQEHLFLPVSGLKPKLDQPRLFHSVFGKFPIDMLLRAEKSEAICGPTVETFLELDESEFSDDYYPSEATMMDYFRGLLLFELVQEKGYQLVYGDEPLKELCVRNIHALKHARSYFLK